MDFTLIAFFLKAIGKCHSQNEFILTNILLQSLFLLNIFNPADSRLYHKHECDFDTHECDFRTHACDFHTLCVEQLCYNININLSCRHIAAAVLKNNTARHCYRAVLHVDSTRMHVDSTRMRVQSL
jgi:hypothetical protein